MFKLIVFDLKNRLKKPMTWFLIILLCVIIGANFLEIQGERLTRPFVGHNVLGINQEVLNFSEYLLDDKEKEAYPIIQESLKFEEQVCFDILKATNENDYSEASRLISLWHLTWVKKDRLNMDPMSDILVKNDIYDIWVDVADGIPYDSIDYRPLLSGMGTDAGRRLAAEYYRNLYINNWEPIYNDEVNNLNGIYSYFFKIIPAIIFLVSILFAYNNVNKDKNNGALKLILTQSMSRWKYYINQWASSVMHIVTIIFIPPIVMSVVGGMIGGFSNFKYPLFYIESIFTRLAPIPNYFDIVKKEYRVPELHTRVFGHIAPGNVHTNFGIHDDTDIIPFYQYVIIVSVLIILFVMFMVAFVQLVSAIINHEIISLIASTGCIGIFVYMGLPFTQGRTYNLNPFTFSNASRIVEGTWNVTVLTSILIMILSTVVLLALGYKYFKKKEI